MYLPNFLDGFDRLVAFDAETTLKAYTRRRVCPQATFRLESPWHHHQQSVSSKCCAKVRAGGRSETWSSRVNPDGPIDPEAIKIHRIRPADLKNAPRFPTILPKMKDFVGESPIVAHAYENERDFLDYELARAKVIEWGESAYPEGRYICTQVLFVQLFLAPVSRLPPCAIGWCSTATKRDDRQAHCSTPT